jgi:thiol-disulfide isomerase/thioredoxin
MMMLSLLLSLSLISTDTQIVIQILNHSDEEGIFIIEELPFGIQDTIVLCSEDAAMLVWNKPFFYGKINDQLVFAEPTQPSNLILDANKQLSSSSPIDVFLQNLLVSTNHLIAKHTRLIAGGAPPENMIALFLNEEQKRLNDLLILESDISSLAFEFLHYQNKARIRNFLFYYLRELKSISPTDTIYDLLFMTEEGQFWSTLPNPVIYSREIQWHRVKKSDALMDLYQYLRSNPLLTALWVKDLLEFPQSWPFLKDVLSPVSIDGIIKNDVTNPHHSIYQNQVNAFNALSQGNPFPQIEFLNTNLESTTIDQYAGNYMLIDFWAVWCAPCIKLRNQLNSINPVEGLYFVSVNLDKNKQIWFDFLEKNHLAHGSDWYLPDGFSAHMVQKLGLSFIPRIMILDKRGNIMDPNFQFNEWEDLRQQLIRVMK